MANYCPSCGTKVDEGYKFCLSCGANLESGTAPNPDKPEEKLNQESSPQPTPVQQGYMPPKTPKSKKNLFIALIAIIAIIVVIVVIIMFSGGGIDNRFVGEWEMSTDGFETFYWVFNNDGSLKMTGMGIDIEIATWSVSGNKVCLNMRENELWVPEGYADEICYDYEFLNGGNTLQLSIGGSENLVLTKK